MSNNLGDKELSELLLDDYKEEEFYKKLGFPVQSGIDSNDELYAENDCEDEVDFVAEKKNVPENILHDIMEQEDELEAASEVTNLSFRGFLFLLHLSTLQCIPNSPNNRL